MPRPEIPIDWKKVDDLLVSGSPGTEIAGYFSIHPNTFYERVQAKYNLSFTEYLQEKRSKGEAMIRAQQFAKALGVTKLGDNTLLIWLGKNRLKQRDFNEDEHKPPLADQVNIENRLMQLEAENAELKAKLDHKPQAE